jgi:cytoskeletal protein RodZ
LNPLGPELSKNRCVRRGAILAGVWAAGILVAVLLAFAAVAQVASGVAPNDVNRMSQRAIDNELTTPRTSIPAGASTTSTTSTPSTTTTTTGQTPTTTTTPTSAAGSTTTTSPTTAQSAPPPATTTTDTAAPSRPTHNTVTTSQGGTLYTRCTGPASIAYVAAVPKPGYERTQDVEDSGGVRQSFENNHHRSNIEAECSNGVVHAQVEEEADGE